MSRIVNRQRIAGWPSTWALAATVAFASVVLLLRSCAVVAKLDPLSVFAQLRADVVAWRASR